MEQWWQDFLSPRPGPSEKCANTLLRTQCLPFSFSVTVCPASLLLSLPLSFFLSFSLCLVSPLFPLHVCVCVRVRVYVCVYVRASRFGCVTFAACASTKLNAGKSSARNISRGNVHLSCGYRGTRTLLGAGPVSEISKTVRKYVGVKATKVCCEATTEIKVQGT